MIVEGYAALFGVADQMRDTVRAGAFAASLARRGALPMLVEHDARLIAGEWTQVREDGRGLFLRGEIRDDLPGAARARRMIARGIDGLSIGFVPVVQHRSAGGRVLSEIELLEVSIVTHPMQKFARLTARTGSRQSAIAHSRLPIADCRLPLKPKENQVRKEVKAAPPPGAADALMRAFEEFKAANDARLDAIERNRGDVLLEEKVDRIDRALTEQKSLIERAALAGRRPGLAADPALSEHKSAWHSYLRRGDISALAQFEAKALSVVGDPTPGGQDGGYVAPPELDRMIESRLRQVSPMREIATVRTTGANVFKKPMSLTAAGTGWAAETGARTQTDTPTLTLLEFPTAELYANLAATQTLLDDSFVNLEEWIASEVEEAFAGQERAAFVNGDGDAKPRGFLDYEAVGESSHVWGKIGHILTGADGAFGTAPVDNLIDLIYAPKTQYRHNGRFVMNRKTLSAVRKLKDGDDRYIWEPNDAGGSSLLGYPVTEIEDMPDIATDARAIAFGDFARGYLIVDRVGVRVLRDPYSAKPYVLFYVTKRVGGGVQNFDAIKALKFGDS